MDTIEKQKHEFALFFAALSDLIRAAQVGDIIYSDDEYLYHRIVHVLRLKSQETVTLFDNAIQVELQLLPSPTKKSVSGYIISKKALIPLTPYITVLLPILKREALEDAIYTCGEIGANSIQLIITEKTQRYFNADKEFARLHNILIAAAEQSKQFTLPLIHKPVGLVSALDALGTTTLIVCCPRGQPFIKILTSISKGPITLLVGPEGDLTASEYTLLNEHGAQLCALTKTILRSQQALTIALGGLRSL